MRRYRSHFLVVGGLESGAAAAAHTGASSVAGQAEAFGRIEQTEQTAGNQSLVQALGVPSRTAASRSFRASCVHRCCRGRWPDRDLHRAGRAWSENCSPCRIPVLYAC